MANQRDDTKQIESPAERLLAAIGKLDKPTSKNAHLYRTSLRRFQAWTAVFHPAADTQHKQALKYLDKLRKVTGKLRDSEVHLDLLEELSDEGGKDLKKLQSELKSRRKAHKKKLANLLSDSLLKETSRGLRLIDTPPQTISAMAEKNADIMIRLALDEYRAFVQNRPPLSPENLHEYRLACKRFRYTAEMARGEAKSQQLTDTWKEVQDVSGEWHDYLTLADLSEKICGEGRLHALLIERRDAKYNDSVAAVEKAEQLVSEQSARPPRKQPRAARSDRSTKIA